MPMKINNFTVCIDLLTLCLVHDNVENIKIFSKIFFRCCFSVSCQNQMDLFCIVQQVCYLRCWNLTGN